MLFRFNLRLPTPGIENLPLYGAHDDPSGLPFIGNNELETEVGPSTIRIPDLIIRRPTCLPNRIYTFYAAAQSPTQTSILNRGKHPRSYEKVSS
jgi:hypothetical protein